MRKGRWAVKLPTAAALTSCRRPTMTSTLAGQLLLGTDKRNPLFTVYHQDEGERAELHVYYGLELLEVVSAEHDEPDFKMLVGRLANAGVSRRVLQHTFEVDPKTIQRWGRALRCRNASELIRVFAGRRANRKLTPEIQAYVRMRWPDLAKDGRYGIGQRLRQEIQRVFNLTLSQETLRPLLAELRSQPISAAWAMVEARAPLRCTASVDELGSLLAECQSLPEFRRPQALGYPIAGLFALIVMATFCEVVRGQRDLAAFARKLSQKQLAALGFRCNPHTGRRRCPGETVFFRVLGHLPEEKVEPVLLRWQDKFLGPAPDTLIAIDGKELRHARGQQLVSAIGVASGRWLGTVRVTEKSNEIPAAQTLVDRLGPAQLDSKLVVVDALHTQDVTAQKLHFECGADYLMTVKANQKGLYQTLETKLQPGPFSPGRRD